jgi:pimeloyl-ACP methyl ester carboxylesterase
LKDVFIFLLSEVTDMANEDKAQAAFDNFVQLWTTATTAGRRAPVLRRPGEVGLDYEDIFFPSMDGVPLEGWFIPADSDRLIIHNHFLPGNRYGYPGHLPEFGGLGGFEVNFLPEYKALHEAGYNVLAYDMSNHGLSGSRNGGIAGIGLLEYRDVIGSLRYATTQPDTKNMKKALLSVCLGADSTAVAWSKHPAEFSEIQAMVMLQPVSGRYIVEEFVKSIGMDDGYEKFDKAVQERTGFHLSEQSPLEHVKAVTVPTLVAQVHDDTMTRPQDVQDIYDAIPVTEKRLYWIEGTNRRFDGYNFFGVQPELPIEWFDKHIN